MADNVTAIDFSEAAKKQLEGITQTMNAVKTENAQKIEGLTTSFNAVKTGLEDQKKTLDEVEKKVGLITASNSRMNEPKKHFGGSLTKFFNAVIESAKNGNRPDKMHEGLKGLFCNPGTFNAIGSDEASAISNPDGGFFLAPEFYPQLLKLDPLASQADTGTRTLKIPMTSTSVLINARTDKNHASGSVTGGLQMYRTNETDSVNATKSQYEQIRLDAKPLMGIAYATELLLAQSPVSFAAIISEGFQDEKISKLNYERLWGSGVGEFTGIMNSPALITVAKTSGQTLKTITQANLYNMRARAWKYADSIWMANQDTIPALMAMDASQFKLWQPSLRDDMPDMLFGRPLLFDENMATLGTAGDIALIDWSEYLEGQLGGATFMESIHVRFVNAERAFRITLYNDGAPWWRSALTPKLSTSTLSPYITLATRA